jgi:cell division protein FtsL
MAQIGRVYDSFHEYDQNPFQPTDRFYVRPSVYLPNSDMDLRTGMLKEDSYRRGRTQAIRQEMQKLDTEYDRMMAALAARQNEKGLRVSVRSALIGFLLLVLVLTIYVLVQQGVLAQRQRMLRSINTRIESVQAENAALQEKIAEASDAATICYAAARNLGMVPAASTQAINLTAMDTRPAGPDASLAASANADSVSIGP